MQPVSKNNTQDLLVIMGPTASGKTRVAVSLAKELHGEIISADSRQVYKRMDIGTGKDLSEYQTSDGMIPYHLIDILEPGEKYNLHRFQQDFKQSYFSITEIGRQPILCGGTGLYIESVLKNKQFTSVPIEAGLRERLESLQKEELLEIFHSWVSDYDSLADLSSRKRLIRAIEIKRWLAVNPGIISEESTEGEYPYRVYCINPPVDLRRKRISQRLHQRLEEGMIEEVENLLNEGIDLDTLIYYGLEYKYIALYCEGSLTLEAMIQKLETEIHRYAKRQMTYFRHMEKVGIPIRWVDGTLDSSQILTLILEDLNLEKI